jgi:regulation of enolase protein 1 (concanavalin A-like superfamily)
MKRIGTGLLVAVLLGGSLGPAVADEKEPVLFTEPFDGRLDTGWSWVREDPKAWRLDKGALVVRTSTGALWQKENNNRNLLLRMPPEAKEGRLAVEVQVENEPSGAFEHAGLVWYYDDDSYVMLNKERVGSRQVVQLVSEKESRPKVGFAEKAYDGKTVWLRLEVFGGKARGLFRATEKDDWQALGQCDLPGRGEARVGLITGYGPKDAEHWSRFRNFRIVQGVR